MNSIMTKGVFTSYGFFSIIFIVLGIYFFTKFIKIKRNSCIDKKKIILSIISCFLGIFFLILYILQLKTIL